MTHTDAAPSQDDPIPSVAVSALTGPGVARVLRRRWVLACLAVLSHTAPLAAQEDESRGLVVRELAFSGNHAIDDLTLRVSIGTSQSSVFARWGVFRWIGIGERRYFDEREFRRDVVRILALYRRSGYREASVDTLVRRTNEDVYVRFIIDEGEPIRVTSFTLTGMGSVLDERATLRNLPLQVGDPFNLMEFQASVDTLRMMLRNRGHPFPEIFQNFDVDVPGHTAAIHLDVDPGVRARVASIQVEGAGEVDEGVIRKWLVVNEGQLFSERSLQQSQRALYRTGLFNFVSLNLVDTASTGAADTTVTVRLRVAEAPLRRIRMGAGYGTVDCFRTLAAWTVLDFLGGGRTFDVTSRLSKIGVGAPFDAGFESSLCPALSGEDTTRLKLNYNITATLREPFFLSRHVGASISVTAERYSEFQAFLREAVGGEATLTWRTPVEVPVNATYALSRGVTLAEPAKFCVYLNVCRVEDTQVFAERRWRSAVGLSFLWDRTDSPLDPARGTRMTGELRHASSAIGSDSLIQFTSGVVEFASHHRVGRRGVFSWRVRFGAVTSPRLALESGRTRFVPPDDRLYAGGPSTVRGFSQNELGPIVRVIDTVFVNLDSVTIDTATVADDFVIRGSATGGDRVVLANAELRFPLPGFGARVFGAAFVDAGQVSDPSESGEALSRIKVTPGLGMRVVTALGPMRLDVAYNPYDPRRGSLYAQDQQGNLREVAPDFAPTPSFLGRFRVHLSVGQAF